MKIAIVGPGALGRAIAGRLKLTGHDVAVTYSRDEASLAAAAQALGVMAKPAGEAARWADILALTVPYGAVDGAIAALDPPAGSILWDCMNPINADMTGLTIGTTTSGAERIAAIAPQCRVVKAIPTFADLLASDEPRVAGRPVTAFVMGDDAAAKADVTALMHDLPTEPVDLGGLSLARLAEPTIMVLAYLAYGKGLGPRIALNLTVEGARQ